MALGRFGTGAGIIISLSQPLREFGGRCSSLRNLVTQLLPSAAAPPWENGEKQLVELELAYAFGDPADPLRGRRSSQNEVEEHHGARKGHHSWYTESHRKARLRVGVSRSQRTAIDLLHQHGGTYPDRPE
jgi:hypothetical protein